MTTPWKALKATEMVALELRRTSGDLADSIESLRRHLALVAQLPAADEAICYHGASALVAEFDGRRDLAIYHRRLEIQKIEYLHELAKRNPGDRAGLKSYGPVDLALRNNILRELEGETTA